MGYHSTVASFILCTSWRRMPFKTGLGGSMDSGSAFLSVEILLSRVGAPPPGPWPDGGPESLRSLIVDWLFTTTKPNLSKSIL
ncbi:hypothetical protein PoB_003959400 [Plakobranchus ocellatus]|uniref:Uncharacterized protein n=1 Tax=Plakobranchus ocellatus TaxID=259542 RepID=A0AAV4B365_9GAST|nr:hypothetical protein PoB_003959400 [Plakobranchus ocellatus]